MIRLHFVVEGQTEEQFVQSVLVPHLGLFNVVGDVRSVETSRTRLRVHRGGVIDYGRVKRDMERWMREDRGEDSYFTTMFDLYGLPSDFPGHADAQSARDPYERVGLLESAFALDFDHRRFAPHLQLHEFEALILANPPSLLTEFNEHADAVQNLTAEIADFKSPELIDDGPETAPSKRIIRAIPQYAGRKASAGPNVVAHIGLGMLRERCPHFSQWLACLEQLTSEEVSR